MRELIDYANRNPDAPKCEMLRTILAPFRQPPPPRKVETGTGRPRMHSDETLAQMAAAYRDALDTAVPGAAARIAATFGVTVAKLKTAVTHAMPGHEG